VDLDPVPLKLGHYEGPEGVFADASGRRDARLPHLCEVDGDVRRVSSDVELNAPGGVD
jgi:hypothetical protein